MNKQLQCLLEKLLKKKITIDNLREVICYNENYITGERKEMKKLKPNKGIKTKIKVLLNDALTGELTEEAVTENILNNFIAKQAFNQWFFNDLQQPTPDNTDRWTHAFRESPSNQPFKRIFLTDYTGAESAEHNRIKGNLIGFARRDSDYAGTDIKRGTINRLESNITFDGNQITIHIVFDFPTHAANGTFQSIWWGSDQSQMGSYKIEWTANLTDVPNVNNKYYNFINVVRNFIAKVGNTYFSRYIGKARFHTCANYNVDGSACWTVYSLDVKYMTQLNTPIKLKWSDGTDFKDNMLSHCIAYDDVVIGFYYNSSSSNQTYNGHVYLAYTLYKFVWNVSDGTLTSLTALNRTALRDAGSRALQWDSTRVRIIDKDIYIWGYYDLTTEYKQYQFKLSTDFATIAEQTLLTPVVPTELQYYKDYPADTGKKCYISEVAIMKDYIQVKWTNANSASGNYYQLFDRVYTHLNYLLSIYDYRCTQKDDLTSGITDYYSWFAFSNTNKVFVIDDNIATLLKYQRPQAHTLLAAPVTKTPTNTMKIQYDFIIDYVDIEES